jgi:membrane protein DedA with SNARE-associated domain/membrane-associated phospholipid phosphatase
MSPGKIIALVVAVLLLAAVVWKRKRLGFERSAIGALIALALIVWASGLTSQLPNPEKVIEDIAEALGPWTYALVGTMAFLETGAFVGLIAPGEFTVIIGGVVAGQGEIDIVPLIGLAWLCCVLGDSASFMLGRKLGRQFMVKHGPRVKITPERLEKVEDYFSRHGGKTVLIGRFIGLVRAMAPFIAGSSGMPYRTFLPFSVLGTGLWATTFSLLGFFFYRSFEEVAAIAGRVTLVFGTLIAIIVGVVWLYRKYRDEEERRKLGRYLDEREKNPFARPFIRTARWLWRVFIRPFGRVLAPQVRFLWQRITPGEGLGIELTTALATAAVGSYVFALATINVMDVPGEGPTRFDTRVTDLVDNIRVDWLNDTAKVITWFGSGAVVGTLVLISILLLAWKRKPIELLTLAIGSGLTYAGVHITKGAVDRPRPEGSLVETMGSSFPSGHAAYATAYVAMGVIAARVLPNLVSRVALVTGTLIAAALIGASREYLLAHYWSDVVAGWALGATVFATCGIVALVVGYVRNNGGEPAPGPKKGPTPAVDRG